VSSVLITGAHGFLGRNIVKGLDRQGYELNSLGKRSENSIQCDLSKEVPKLNRSYDYVLHCAGKAHVVPRDINDEQEFLEVNVHGTRNLLIALEQLELFPKCIVYISTVAVYGMTEGENIDEKYPLLGTSPYAKSKILAEELLSNWCNKNNVTLAIFRPSLIAGSNPPGNLGSLIKGIESGKYIRLGSGSARKSVLMASDISDLFTKVLSKGGVYNVCADHHPSFFELEQVIANQLNKKIPISIPLWVAYVIGWIGDVFKGWIPVNSEMIKKMTSSLTFSNERAKKELDWQPSDVLKNFKI